MERVEVYKVIDGERDYQDEKWKGTASGDTPGKGALDRSVDEYALYIQGYTNELTHLASHYGNPSMKLDVVRKIAALAVACMERHGAVERKQPLMYGESKETNYA